MKDRPWYPIVYMFVVTAAFSSVLIGLSRFTRSRVEANKQLAFERAVLQALPLELPARASSVELHRIFAESIRAPDESSAGAYTRVKDDRIAAYALPIRGRGFWDEIRGVIGIAPDRRTITGVAFYQQNETPGLGAQITTVEFRRQFVGKKIADSGQAFSIKPATAELGESDVHAVTGATQTSTRLETIISDDLGRWREKMMHKEKNE